AAPAARGGRAPAHPDPARHRGSERADRAGGGVRGRLPGRLPAAAPPDRRRAQQRHGGVPGRRRHPRTGGGPRHAALFPAPGGQHRATSGAWPAGYEGVRRPAGGRAHGGERGADLRESRYAVKARPRDRLDGARLADGRAVVRHWAFEGHWSTSVAWASTDWGIVSPSCWAVLRLITKSNLVGCSTGRSAGLAPLRILST